MSTAAKPTSPAPHFIRTISLAAMMHPRTVRRFFVGGEASVSALTAARIQRAAADLGIDLTARPVELVK